MTERRFLRLLLYIVFFCVGIVLLFRFLLPVLLPFLIAFLFSQLTEPAVRLLNERWKLPRAVNAALVMAALFAFLGLILVLLVSACAEEISRLTERLPELVEGLRTPMESVQQWLLGIADRIPDGMGQAARLWIIQLFSDTSAFLGQASDLMLSLASRTVSALPGLFLFFVTTVVASFMISAQRQSILEWLQKKIPQEWMQKGQNAGRHLKKALGGWLRAELRMMLITFGVISVGLFVLGAEFPLVLGAVTALVDALPVLGTGTILIPWALWMLLKGNTVFGVSLLILYGLAAMLRATLEPRLVGRQIGLHPLLALLSMYAGFQLFGLGGMVFLPIAAILARQLWVFGGVS